jgi:hypothetical protein
MRSVQNLGGAMWLPAAGLGCLGFVMIFICMYLIVRLKKPTIAGLGGVVGVFLGGVLAKFLTDYAATPGIQNAVWWYPIGLFVGLLVWGRANGLFTMKRGGGLSTRWWAESASPRRSAAAVAAGSWRSSGSRARPA